MTKILILGKTPPPVGGITNHVSRLVENLPKQNFTDFTFCDLGKEPPHRITCEILKHQIIHLHVSRPWLQFLFTCFCKISGKKLLLTYHGNWGRYNWMGNWLVCLSARMAAVPIVQNEGSLIKAKLMNGRAILISTFLPPSALPPLDLHIALMLEDFRKNYEIVLCSNAWNLTFDKNGKETYGISELVRRIENTSEIGLILSDPSGNYQKFLPKLLGRIPGNVMLITQPHDFRHILSISDAFVRNTTTDGISLSIHEALELNVPILASSVVTRPAFCKVYDDLEKLDFEKVIGQARELLKERGNQGEIGTKTIKDLVRLYTSFA